MLYDQSTRAALYGAPGENNGVLTALDKSQLPLAPMEVPQLHKLILESGKLAKLDELLVTLKQGGHRVLVYFQMTRMIDLMEEYLAFRQYKYLRLDGSSSISERRDMVSDWQSKPEIFIFLLSTRAGGLGINLTAADTVIFYDSDWNPSNDAQAMDRAHRLGQTRQVTVYRLITKNTIDERILQLARTKKSVQDAVVGSSTQVVGGAVSASGDVKSNEVVSLLLDDDELAESIRQSEANKAKQEAKMIDNGKKGAKAREENKKAREIAAAAKKQGLANGGGSMLGPGQGWGMQDDDEDAFGFFSSAKGKGAAGDDDMDAEGDDDAEGEVEGGSTAKPAAKGKGKGKAKAKSEPADPNAPPKKKRAPAVRKPPELGPDGQPIKKPRKPKAKKVEPPAAL
jgi:DNA helicase INO80